MKRNQRIGVLLIILGILLSLALIVFSVYHAHEMWISELKYRNFDSFTEYYFIQSDVTLLFASIIGILLVSEGVIYCRK